MAFSESPPPTTEVADEAATALASATVPVSNGGFSKMPMGPFQITVLAEAITCENFAMVAGPISTAILSAGMVSTTSLAAPAAISDTTTWSTGSISLPPSSASSFAASGTLSSSTSDLPVGRPCALRNVYAMAPPISSWSTILPRFSITSILSDTLAPPRMATHGRGGLVVAIPRYFSSCSISRPAAAAETNRTMPSVDAWARCALPNASLT